MTGMRIHVPRGVAVVFSVLFWILPASRLVAQVLDEPDRFEVTGQWSASSLGIPGPLGALLFDPDEGVLYVVGAAESANSALYAVPVSRDAETGKVNALGPAGDVFAVFNGGAVGLDSGCALGPEGTLFNTYYNANLLGQRPGGVEGAERLFDMFLVGVPSSVTGLTFSPYIVDEETEFAMMQVSSWGQGAQDIYNVPLIPIDDGYFEPLEVSSFLTLPTASGAGAIHYVPSGPHAGDLMYVDWGTGSISMALIDQETGFPVDSRTDAPALGTPFPSVVSFASGMGAGPWGLDFDPVTHDLYVSTWEGAPFNSIVRIEGFPPPTESRRFLRGDCNADGAVSGQVTDAVFLLTYNFLGGPEPACLAACDVNADGNVAGQVTDAVYLLTFNFLGGPSPPAPFPECGEGTADTDEAVGCETVPRNCR